MQAWRSYDSAAADYEAGRPAWPVEAIDVAGVSPDAIVLDLAAGTGKLTRLLVERFPRAYAVEPLAGMRALLEQLVPEAEALAGEAEAIPLPDASVDAVFVAEAFHWFGGPPAVAEIARVLRSGGTLVLLWNERGGPTRPSLPEAYRARIRARSAAASWPYGDRKWMPAVEAGPFGPIHEASVANEHVLDRGAMLAAVRSRSWIASLDERERAEELRALGDLLPDGTWTVPIRVDVFWARRR